MTTAPRPPAQNIPPNPHRSPLAVAIAEFPMTLGLIVVCVLVFICQTVMGVNPTEPTNQDLLNWGANFMPYTLSYEGWRMVTSLFLHIGFLHLLFNMFALYYFGQVAERMYGSVHLLLLFLLSGIGGNVLNNYLAWQGLNLMGYAPTLSAGASGGIMGIGTALLISALTKMQVGAWSLNFKSLLMVMVINIGYGFFVTGIDNAGHIGGAVTGLLLGLGYFWRYKKQLKESQLKSSPISMLLHVNQVDKSNYALWAMYAGVMLFLEVVFFQLHITFIHLPAVGLRTISGF